MKNILYIHHSGKLGGAPRSLTFLLQELKKKRLAFQSSLYCISNGPILDFFKKQRIDFKLIGGIYPFHGSTVVEPSLRVSLSNIIKAPFTFYNAYKLVKSQRPSLIHLNSTCLFVTAIAAKAYDRNIKIICHVREPLRQNFSGNVIRAMCFKYVDKFIAIDSYTASSMKHRNNLEVVYNSVDFSSYNSNIKSSILYRELNLEKDAVVFLYLARLAEGNGTIELIKAAKKAVDKNDKIHVVVAGYDPSNQSSYSKKVFNEAIGIQNIHFLDFREDVPDLIASSDVMVVPFTEPHFARSIIEASAMGKPTLGAKIGGVEEVINHGTTGYLFSTEEELVKYMLALATSKELRDTLGINAEKYARQNFDVKSSSERVFHIYQELVN